MPRDLREIYRHGWVRKYNEGKAISNLGPCFNIVDPINVVKS